MHNQILEYQKKYVQPDSRKTSIQQGRMALKPTPRVAASINLVVEVKNNR